MKKGTHCLSRLGRLPLFGLAALLCLLIAGARLGAAYWHNTKFCTTFLGVESLHDFRDDGGYNFYDGAGSMADINIPSLLHRCDDKIPGLLSTPGETPVPTFPLPCDVTYYREEGETPVPAITLKKGTEVIALDTSRPYRFRGYGYHTFPTQQRGWRYTRPFLVADGLADDPIASRTDPRIQYRPYYYVKTSEMEAVLRSLVRAHNRLGYAFLGEGNTVESALFTADILLFREGIFCSPDLGQPYFDILNIVLLCAPGVLLPAQAIVWLVRRWKREPDKRRFFARFPYAGCTAILCLVAVGVRLGLLYQKNTAFFEYFLDVSSLSDFEPDLVTRYYDEAESMEDIRFINLMRRYYVQIGYAYSDSSWETPVPKFRLPVDLDYYTKQDGGLQLAFTLKKGTEVIAADFYQEAAWDAYGRVSFPTFQRGWRYTRPFLETGGADDSPIYGPWDKRLDGVDFYYIKTSQLRAVSYHLIDAYSALGYDLAVGQYRDYWHLRTDVFLFNRGEFCSPDLGYTYLDALNIALLCAAGAGTVLQTGMTLHRRRHAPGRRTGA